MITDTSTKILDREQGEMSAASLNLCETNGSNIVKKEGFCGPSCLNLYDILQFVKGSVMNEQARKCLAAASG